MARLEHPAIVPLYDYWRESGGAYLVMRYVRGGNTPNRAWERPLVTRTSRTMRANTSIRPYDHCDRRQSDAEYVYSPLQSLRFIGIIVGRIPTPNTQGLTLMPLGRSPIAVPSHALWYTTNTQSSGVNLRSELETANTCSAGKASCSSISVRRLAR